jgi:Beta-propeller repeat
MQTRSWHSLPFLGLGLGVVLVACPSQTESEVNTRTLEAIPLVCPILIGSPWSGVKQQGGTGADSASSVAVDADCNVYVAGATNGGVGGGVNLGGYDAYLTKYNKSGTWVWTRQFGTGGADYARGVAVDDNGDVFVGGSTSGDLDGAGAGVHAGGSDAFLRKYDPVGNVLWTAQIGTSSDDSAQGVAVGPSNNAYIAGHTQGDIDGVGAGVHAGSFDAFVVKYDGALGTQSWVKQAGTTSSDLAYGVAVSANNLVYVGGETSGQLGAVANAGLSDAFVIQYGTATGTRNWTVQVGTSGVDSVRGVAVDSVGKAVTAGFTGGSLNGGAFSGFIDAFAMKHDTNGTHLWTNLMGNSDADYANAVAVSSDNEVYVVGQTPTNMGGQSNQGGLDAFLVKYGSGGDRKWTQLLGTSSNDVANGVATDRLGNVYPVGYTFGILGSFAVINHGQDAFTAKYGSDGVKK